MAELSQGIVGGRMPWGLLLMGCLLAVALIMINAPSPMLIAVGMYLPLETTSAIFVGGVLKWLADRLAARRRPSLEERASIEERGTLIASGLIAGEAITGILLAVLFIRHVPSLTRVFAGQDVLPFVAHWGGWLSLIAFAVIAYCLVWIPLRERRANSL